MSHTRKVCPHGVVITQCRCINPNKATEVVRPCPLPAHAGWPEVHPEPPRPDLNRSGYCVAERHDQCPQQPGAPAPRCVCPCHAEEYPLLDVKDGWHIYDLGDGQTFGTQVPMTTEQIKAELAAVALDQQANAGAVLAVGSLTVPPGGQEKDPGVSEGSEGHTAGHGPIQSDTDTTEPEPPARTRRPHWLPEQVWMGVIVGQWPVQTFTAQAQAERWASQAPWDPAAQRYEPRRIWAVDIPAGTQTFTVEKVPASTKLSEVKW